VKLCREVDELWGEFVRDWVVDPEAEVEPVRVSRVPVATGLPESTRLLETAEEGEAAAVAVCPERELCGEVVRDWVVEPETDTDPVVLPSGVTLPTGLPETAELPDISDEADKVPVKLCRGLNELSEEDVSD